ncbi:MAG: hypothetical protein IJ300_03755 [Clostridia bacterium]|nr:hypothetical protein [Clostridia bacterium]
MTDRESIRTEVINDIKEFVGKLMHHGFDEAEIIECIIEAMLVGIVEAIPENERIEYLSENKHIKDFIKYVDINNVLSEIFNSKDGLYTAEMLENMLRIKISVQQDEKFFLY